MESGSTTDDIRAVQPQAQIKTLLLLDMVDSTGMIERLGDLKATEHIRRHDRFVRDLVKVHGGREIDKTDGFLLVFGRPIQAAAFALTYQRALKDNPELPIRTRIGLHVGEVVLYENSADDVAAGAKAVELEGLTKPVAARLMSLALPGQILLSDMGHAMLARSFHELQQRFPQVSLRDHGIWHLKGVHEAMQVHELGEPGVAPFARPLDVEKVRHDRRRLLLAAAASVGTAAVGGGGWWWWQNRSISIPFEKRDWVVVGDFINDTGQELLDDSLEQAFRIGLEQSQFVNVVPDLQVRDSLKRMRVETAHPLRDRRRVCEVAVRENARAVVIPRVSSQASELVISSELIEPRSQRTVALDSTSASGFAGLVAAVDQLVRNLRQRFGESRPAIDQETLPLAQVTSADLEALRSYSLGLKAFTQGEYEEARTLFEHAVSIDAEFAAAYAKLSGIFFVMGRLREARQAAEKAAAVKDRLTARERLYVDGTLTLGKPPAQMLEKWALLARLFPDFKVGQHNCGFVEWQYQNRFADSIRWLESIAHTRFPQQAVSLSVLGYALLGDERHQDADQAFVQAREISGSHYAFGRVDSLICLDRDREAAQLLTEPRPAAALFAHYYDLRQTTFLAMAGKLRAAAAACENALQQTTAAGQRSRLRYIGLSIAEIAGQAGLLDPLELAIADELQAFTLDPLDLDYAPQFQLALLASMLARLGQWQAAAEIATTIRDRCANSGFFFRERVFAMLEAEIALAQGRPEAVPSSLLLGNDVRRLVCEDEMALRLQRATGAVLDLNVLRGLATRTGRALSEWNEGFTQQLRNAWIVQRAQVDLLEQEPGSHANLRRMLQARWADADSDHALVVRLRRLQPAT